MRSIGDVQGLRRMTRTIVRRIPPELRALRSAMMLEQVCESFRVEDVTCPACAGTGWLDEERLDCCPLCCGFREVPGVLADWFTNQLAVRRDGEDGGAPPGGARPAGDASPGREAPGERLGRMAEMPYRLHLSHFD